MNKKFKVILTSLLCVAMIGITGCDGDRSKVGTTGNPLNEASDDLSDNGSSNGDETLSKEEYATYLTDRYNYYLGTSKLYNDYDIYIDDFSFQGTNEEFITAYGSEYQSLKSQLEAFKADLEANVKKGDGEIDKFNDKVIKSIDANITAIDKFNGDYTSATSGYGTFEKDDFVNGLKDLGKGPYDARMDLDNLVRNVKSELNIQ